MKTKEKIDFKKKLRKKMDEYAHLAYGLTRDFPKEEVYGITSQLRRSALSVALNYIEGYARRKSAVQLNFFEISYGSLKESKYLFNFSSVEGFLSKKDYELATELADEIGAMLWTEISFLKKSLE